MGFKIWNLNGLKGACLRKLLEQLTPTLSQLLSVFLDNNLIVNLKKSKIEKIPKKTSRIANFDIKMNGIQINEFNVDKYLGVTMEKSWNYLEHLNETLKKAASRVLLLL